MEIQANCLLMEFGHATMIHQNAFRLQMRRFNSFSLSFQVREKCPANFGQGTDDNFESGGIFLGKTLSREKPKDR